MSDLDLDGIRHRAFGLRRGTFPPAHRESVLATVLEDDIPGLVYEVEQLQAMKARLEVMCNDWDANGYLPAAIVVRSQMLGIDYNPVFPISTRMSVTEDIRARGPHQPGGRRPVAARGRSPRGRLSPDPLRGVLMAVPEGVMPTPAQMVEWFMAADDESRLRFMEGAATDATRAHDCFIEDHARLKDEIRARDALLSAARGRIDLMNLAMMRAMSPDKAQGR